MIQGEKKYVEGMEEEKTKIRDERTAQGSKGRKSKDTHGRSVGRNENKDRNFKKRGRNSEGTKYAEEMDGKEI